MTLTPHHGKRHPGASLIEVVIAIGVLAVAVPLAFATIAKSSQNSANARAETRCAWIIPACLDEIDAATLGKSTLLPPRTPGQAYPASGNPIVLAFTEDGRPVATLDPTSYRRGIASINNQPARYLVTLSATRYPNQPTTDTMLNLHLVVEYPATAPSHKRSKIDFHSRIP